MPNFAVLAMAIGLGFASSVAHAQIYQLEIDGNYSLDSGTDGILDGTLKDTGPFKFLANYDSKTGMFDPNQSFTIEHTTTAVSNAVTVVSDGAAAASSISPCRCRTSIRRCRRNALD